MEVVATIVLAFIALLGAAVSKQIADEYKSWTPWIVERFIRRSVNRLPDDLKERFNEEWRSHILEIPGETGKIIVAAGFLSASRKMALAPEQEIKLVYRMIDVLFAVILMILFLPYWVILSIVIKVRSKGPVFRKVQRVRSNGSKYFIYHFRIDEVENAAEEDEKEFLASESYKNMSIISKFLYRSQIYLIPEIISLFKGDLSLFRSPPVILNTYSLIFKSIYEIYKKHFHRD